MKEIIQSYSRSVDETHIQIGERTHEHTSTKASKANKQTNAAPPPMAPGGLRRSSPTTAVHTEFVRNIENTSVDSLIHKLAESKGTGKERPGECGVGVGGGIERGN
ncbi:F-BAR domain only protein 2 [Liparis tanakae]|uniref:F-BAR domain only protein 2 n=1 Tax=Liparis tanakae TaxID=230148 RepID=A0A4Z2EUB1_9TELE|nr:F-BAR domain only protein 2 [Liparis tanakae]